MVSDNRVKHDPLTRSLALELFERGFGYMFVSSHLGIPRDTVRQWYYKYSVIGSGGVLMMGGK
ncbi:helix-turn-helix domain-containing protein, partial [Peptococcus simiae]|uniref:helix-turn-helix domain-containing protein n=1 Tax=Peptococcus simiae TaxID=1643805 RepID=UPI00397EF730